MSSVVFVPDRVLDLVLLPSEAVSDQYFPLSPVSSIPLSSAEPVAAVACHTKIFKYRIWVNLPKKLFIKLVNSNEIYIYLKFLTLQDDTSIR